MAPKKAPEGILAHGAEAAPTPARKRPPSKKPTPPVDRKSVEQQIGEAYVKIMKDNGLGRGDLKRMEAYVNMVQRAARARYGWFNKAFPPGSSV